jgi:hypothetical protein
LPYFIFYKNILYKGIIMGNRFKELLDSDDKEDMELQDQENAVLESLRDDKRDDYNREDYYVGQRHGEYLGPKDDLYPDRGPSRAESRGLVDMPVLPKRQEMQNSFEEDYSDLDDAYGVDEVDRVKAQALTEMMGEDLGSMTDADLEAFINSKASKLFNK